jgi:O-antigen/teichoic acid export membrane protein
VASSFLNGIGKTRETLRLTLIQLAIFLPSAAIMAWLYRVPD